MIGETLAHFRITSKLGAGGMGEVYRAEDTKLGRAVAIKVLPEIFTQDPERLARFEREARVLAALNHPKIAAIYSIESARLAGTEPASEETHPFEAAARSAPRSPEQSADEAPADRAPRGAWQIAASGGTTAHFLVMELAEGETLQERIARGALSVEEAMPLARQIAEALEAAHEMGIVHRDLKPANVKVDDQGGVKVLDFGLARALDPTLTDVEPHRAGASPTVRPISLSPTLTAQMTSPGVLLGTAAYMSPEQARGQTADKRADIWAFGVVLMEMLSGGTVFSGDTVSDTLAGVLAREPEWQALPESTPRAIRRLIARCLTKDVKQRLRDIGEARIAIDAFEAAPETELAEEAAFGTTTEPIPGWRRALPWVLAGALALGLSVVAIWSLRRGGDEPPLLRTTVLPPEGHTWYLDGVFPGPVVVSPDGRALAFTAVAEGEADPVLWVRPLASPVGRPLAGTEGASYPFWSPDARHLAFYAGGSLKKVAVAGGPPVTLCKARYGKGGAWSQKGVIVFPPEATGPLSRVPAAGGECVALTALDAEAGDNSHRHPRFLPDGERFLYLARRPGLGDRNVLRAGSLDGTVSRDLVPTPTNGEYASGRLLFLRDSTLMAQPFDAERLEPAGEAVPLIENVLTSPGAALAVFAASQNGVMVHQSGRAISTSRLDWFDRSGNLLEPVGEPADQTQVVLSPDGSKAAVVVVDAEDQADIWIDDLRRGLRSRFTFDAADDVAPVWSPEGDRLAFSSNRGGSEHDLYLKTVGGSGDAELLHASELSKFAWSWSADSSYLLYTEVVPNSGNRIWALPVLSESAPILLLATEFEERQPMISPDGRWLAYTSDESGTDQIYVTTFPEPGRKWQVSIDGGYQPLWYGDGGEIFFLSGAGDRLHVAEVAGSGENFEIGAVEQLFEPTLRGDLGRDWDVTADGQRFLLNSAMDPGEISALQLTVNWPVMLEPD